MKALGARRPVAVWSSSGGFARSLLDLLRRLGASGFIPRSVRECRKASRILLDRFDEPLLPAGCASQGALIVVDRSDPLGSMVDVVEKLSRPYEYLMGIDPGMRMHGVALLANGTLVYGGVYGSVEEVASLACSVSSRVSAPLLVGVGSSPSAAEAGRRIAALLSGCGLDVKTVDEHSSNKEYVPGMEPALEGVSTHVRAAAVIALRASTR